MNIDVNEFLDFISIPVVAFCFLCGYIIKNHTPFPNNLVPLAMLVIGIIGNIIVTISGPPEATINLQTFITGGISGFAATGSYEFIVRTFGLKKSNKEEPPDNDNNE